MDHTDHGEISPDQDDPCIALQPGHIIMSTVTQKEKADLWAGDGSGEGACSSSSQSQEPGNVLHLLLQVVPALGHYGEELSSEKTSYSYYFYQISKGQELC
jgi:hypothetical protein